MRAHLCDAEPRLRWQWRARAKCAERAGRAERARIHRLAEARSLFLQMNDRELVTHRPRKPRCLRAESHLSYDIGEVERNGTCHVPIKQPPGCLVVGSKTRRFTDWLAIFPSPNLQQAVAARMYVSAYMRMLCMDMHMKLAVCACAHARRHALKCAAVGPRNRF